MEERSTAGLPRCRAVPPERPRLGRRHCLVTCSVRRSNCSAELQWLGVRRG